MERVQLFENAGWCITLSPNTFFYLFIIMNINYVLAKSKEKKKPTHTHTQTNKEQTTNSQASNPIFSNIYTGHIYNYIYSCISYI